jgi:hypothetical protein
MVERPIVEYETVERILLLRLHLALSKSMELKSDIAFLARHLEQPLQLVKICSKRLESQGYCEIVTTTNFVEHPETGSLIDIEEESLNITEIGVSEVESWPENLYSNVALNFGLPSAEWEIEFLERNVNLTSSELGETEWEPLSIDRSTSEYKNFEEKLEDAVEKIESDNGYSSTHPEERDTVVWSLKEGLKALKELTPTKEQIRSLIEVPLNRAIQIFKDSIPGLAATLAKEALKEWVKSWFKS